MAGLASYLHAEGPLDIAREMPWSDRREFHPAGPMHAHKNATKVKPDAPVLWIAGGKVEAALKKFGWAAPDLLPSSAASNYVGINADRLNTPDAAKFAIGVWFDDLK